MSMSPYPTDIKPEFADTIQSTVLSSVKNLIPNHTLEVKYSLAKRGCLKYPDKHCRSHYIKLDCTLKNDAGLTVQVFNRFILLNPLKQLRKK